MEFTSILADIPLGIVIAIALSLVFWATAFSRPGVSATKGRPFVRATIGLVATLALIAMAMIGLGPNGGLWASLPQLTKIFVVGILALWAYIFFYRFTSVTIASAPTVLTTLGIFGTFIGIAWGLSGFNAQDVQGSIPALLDGLKTSFWSSVVGIGGAVSIKMKHLFIVSLVQEKDLDAYEATLDDVATLLQSLNKSLREGEESTVVSELMAMRRDANDRLDSLRRSFEEFVKEMEAKLEEQNRQLHEHVAGHSVRVELPRQPS
jgi:hypothetical protein